jgi:hypothetical protein
MCVSQVVVIVDGGILSAILQVFTRYSANDPPFPVNERSLFTGKFHAIGGASRPNGSADGEGTPRGRCVGRWLGARRKTKHSIYKEWEQSQSSVPAGFQDSHPIKAAMTPTVSMKPWAKIQTHRLRFDSIKAAPRIRPAMPESRMPEGPL